MNLPMRSLLGHPIRNSAYLMFQNPLVVRHTPALISFTFDDCPRSALWTGGAILRDVGAKATYYLSLGLLGQDSPSGPLMDRNDMDAALQQGHELGCHTFSHLHSWRTDAKAFLHSVLRNQAALDEIIPGGRFRSFSYPISEPSPLNKRAISDQFLTCRSGGQRFNRGRVDRNQLSAYFLEMARGNLQEVKDLIDAANEAGGWIIFATHDIAPQPSRYGCTPSFLEAVARYAADAGARILPVTHALDAILGRTEPHPGIN